MDLSKIRIGNAAGDVKTFAEVAKITTAPITHVVVGSITVEERAGNKGDTFWVSPDDKYALNARGLPCRGIDYYREHGPAMADIAHGAGKQLIVSIASTQSQDDWKRLAECAANFADGVEVNVSCPNKWKDGERESVIAENPEAVRAIIRDVILATPSGFHVGVKLPPFKNPGKGPVYLEMMDALRDFNSGLAEVVSCNTIGGVQVPVIDGKPVLGVPEGGKSGPCLKAWSLMQVRALSESLPNTRITGVGGIRSGADAYDYLEAGATGVQVGTHFFQYGPRVFEEIALELAELDTEAA